MKKSVIAIATVALLATSAFGATHGCQHELKHLKKDLSNITDKGAECLAQKMAVMMNSIAEKQSSPTDTMHMFYKRKTMIMKGRVTSSAVPKMTKAAQREQIRGVCADPRLRILLKHGIKWRVDITTPKQHVVINITEKVCKKNHF
jgi:hypothetical protein